MATLWWSKFQKNLQTKNIKFSLFTHFNSLMYFTKPVLCGHHLPNISFTGYTSSFLRFPAFNRKYHSLLCVHRFRGLGRCRRAATPINAHHVWCLTTCVTPKAIGNYTKSARHRYNNILLQRLQGGVISVFFLFFAFAIIAQPPLTTPHPPWVLLWNFIRPYKNCTPAISYCVHVVRLLISSPRIARTHRATGNVRNTVIIYVQ